MLLNDYLGNKSFQAFLNYEENIKKIEQHSIVLKETSDNIQKSADEKLEKVEQLSDTLKNLKQGFNFVALSDGFSRMLNEKKSSKKWILRLLFLIAVIISAIPVYKFLSDGGINLTWQQIAISAGLELVLIYFFRVVLFHYRTVQTQIMQLDLRLSLCQFIQSYAEYAKEIKTNDKDALDKFENLIFSSILSSDEKIPSTFDGLEQLNSLIKQFKQEFSGSPPPKAACTHQKDPHEHHPNPLPRTFRHRRANHCRRRAFGRRCNRALYRPLPQGSHGRVGRHAATPACRAAAIPARVGRAQSRCFKKH